MEKEVNIETGVGATLDQVCRQVAALAGLAVMRGPVGIGKSFALARIAQQLEDQGIVVVMVTASEATAGNINAFLRSILGQHPIETTSSAEAEEAVWGLLAGRPFLGNGRQVIFIVDEAQKLAGRVLETICGIWDRGELAREGDLFAPAFGCVLVGNPTFMGKGGAQRTASFEALIDRLTHNMRLPGPSKAERIEFARSIFDDAEVVDELVNFGQTKGNLRSMAIASRLARQFACDDPVTLAHLRMAIKMKGTGA